MTSPQTTDPISPVQQPKLELRAVPVEEVRPLRGIVLRPGQSAEQLIWDDDDHPDALHIAAFFDGEMVGIGTILPQSHEQEGADGWRIRGMATLPVARGTGVGGAVLEHCMAHAEACGARYIWCNARIKALGLYERRGFATVGDVFEPPEIGPHYRMVKFL